MLFAVRCPRTGRFWKKSETVYYLPRPVDGKNINEYWSWQEIKVNVGQVNDFGLSCPEIWMTKFRHLAEKWVEGLRRNGVAAEVFEVTVF